jgi:hypothetical protein
MELQGDGNTAPGRQSGVFSNDLQQLADVFNGSTRAEMIWRPEHGRCI